MSKLYNKKEAVTALSPEDVVSSGVDFGLYSLRYNPDLSPNVLATSAVPAKTQLGADATKISVVDTKRTKTGLQLAKEPQSLQSRPTADDISTTSYKKDAKLVIRIIPSPSVGSKKKNKSKAQSEVDPAFYFDKFSLQSVAESDEERYQLHETFDSATLFLFGRRPRIWTYQGIVLNGRRPEIPAFLLGDSQTVKNEREKYLLRYNMDFANELIRRYESHYRGTQALALRARSYIVYDDTVVEGTLLSLVAVRNSSIPGAVNATITVVVHQRSFIGTSLTDTGEQTLKQLVNGEVRDLEVSNIVPPAIGAARDTYKQVKARFDKNQDGVVDAQEYAAVLQKDKEAIEREQAQLPQDIDQADADALEALEKIAEGEDLADQDLIDEGKAELAEAEGKKSSLIARQQSLDKSKEDTDEEKADATAKLDEAEAAQKVAQAELDSSSGNEESTCPEGYKQGTVNVVYEFRLVDKKLLRDTYVTGGIWFDVEGKRFEDGVPVDSQDVSDYPEYTEVIRSQELDHAFLEFKDTGCVKI
jgi:hypothetical protein